MPQAGSSSVRLDLGVQAELQWFFERAASEVGWGSNFGAFQTLILTGGARLGVPQPDSRVEQARLLAVRRARRVYSRLQRMRCVARNVLEVAYEPRRQDEYEVRKAIPMPEHRGILRCFVADPIQLVQKLPRRNLAELVDAANRIHLAACHEYQIADAEINAEAA